jgi:hypothetical protein
VEIVSPGSWRDDLLVEPFEHAEAGIPPPVGIRKSFIHKGLHDRALALHP